MEQIYNYTQNDPSYHATGLTAKATDIKNKAPELQQTATTHSDTEITDAKKYDIQGDQTKGTQLTAKANLLKGAASNLHSAAGKLKQAAQNTGNPLQPLNELARQLRDAAGNSTGGDNLYNAAEQLASHGDGISGLELKATTVIDKFEVVQQAYKKLMTEAKQIGKQSDDNVTAVTREYNLLETEYDQMLNLTKLKNTAKELKSTAESQSTSELSQLGTKPTELANKAQNLSTAAKSLESDTHLSGPAGNLKNAAKQDGGQDSDSLYKKATDLASTQNYDKATPVIEAFDNVKNHFDELITLAIDNDKLELVRNVKSKFTELKNYYDGMLPFTKIKYYSDKIGNEAINLRGTSGGTADNIVRYFESMELAYNQLNEKEKPKVKTQFDALNSVYDPILNVTKATKLRIEAGAGPNTGLRQKADQLSTQATSLDVEVKKVDSQENAAKVLKHKAGENDTTPGTLRYLARLLYEKAASQLASAVKGADSNAAKDLKEAVGDTGDSNKLQATLIELGDHTVPDTELPGKAQAVRDAYEKGVNGVKPKFDALKKLETSYQAIASTKPKYEEVEAAMTAFNNVYKPEKLFKEAVGEESDGDSLRKALATLGSSGAGDPTLTDLAKAVKDQYDKVKSKFEEVVKQKENYTVGKVKAEYTQVMNDGRLSIMPNYDVQNNTPQPGLKDKAKELKTAAETLSTQAASQYGATPVSTAATQLRDKAQTLSSEATALPGAPDLAGLSRQANALATAAKHGAGQDSDSLYYHATELSSTPTETNAIAVIEAFNTVKAAYETLSKHSLYQQYKPQPGQPSQTEDSPQGKVQAVEDAWGSVNTQFQTLCKALIKHFANQVETEAGSLAGPSGTSEHADNVIDGFNVVEKAYKELDDQSKVSKEFEAVKNIYNRILNLTKLLKKAGDLQTAAQTNATELSSAAGTLKTNVEALRDGTSGDDHTNAKTVVTKFNEVKDKFDELDTDNKNKVESQFQAIIGLYNHIIIHYPKILQKEAGASRSAGLRDLADKLHSAANALNNAVITVSDENAARVLKAKAGTSDKEDGKLRKLAKDLYHAAIALHGTSPSDSNAAQQLKEAVGNSEADDKLRQKLRELHEDSGTDLTQKAQAVKQKYADVKQKFAEVEKKKDDYEKAGQQAAYQAVVDAMNAFNDLYKPEKQLKLAIGDVD